MKNNEVECNQVSFNIRYYSMVKVMFEDYQYEVS